MVNDIFCDVIIPILRSFTFFLFWFVGNFCGLFLTEFVLFSSLVFPCCSVWLREVKVIVLQQSCCMFMHA